MIKDASGKKYIDYVRKVLKKYNVDCPSKIPNKLKWKFFKELDKGWESKEEKKKKQIIKKTQKKLKNKKS